MLLAKNTNYNVLKKEIPTPSSINKKPSIEIEAKRITIEKNKSYQIKVKYNQNNIKDNPDSFQIVFRDV